MKRVDQEDVTIRCLLLTSVSTCFGHHYAHLQVNKGPVTAFDVLFWFCWMWLVAVVGRCVLQRSAQPLECAEQNLSVQRKPVRSLAGLAHKIKSYISRLQPMLSTIFSLSLRNSGMVQYICLQFKFNEINRLYLKKLIPEYTMQVYEVKYVLLSLFLISPLNGLW